MLTAFNHSPCLRLVRQTTSELMQLVCQCYYVQLSLATQTNRLHFCLILLVVEILHISALKKIISNFVVQFIFIVYFIFDHCPHTVVIISSFMCFPKSVSIWLRWKWEVRISARAPVTVWRSEMIFNACVLFGVSLQNGSAGGKLIHLNPETTDSKLIANWLLANLLN